MIQICASQDDLFGPDADGIVYHYNFNTQTWMTLGRGRQRRNAISNRVGSVGTNRERSDGPP